MANKLIAPSLALALVASVPGGAQANGQTAHLWITAEALTHLPAGPLADLLASHGLELENGTMFPDGGYAVGDGYGEIAHWEPLQVAYLEWILDTYPDLGAPEARGHLAFHLGTASHGMADQIFDSMYVVRQREQDGESDELDAQSDLVMASLTGGRTPPERWVPTEALVPLFLEAGGHVVDADTVLRGQGLLRSAVSAVGALSLIEATVADARARYPWGMAHLLDSEVPGSPPCEGEIVARYWESQWAIAHGEPLPRPVLATRPPDGASGHATDSSSIDSWISIVFARGLVASSLVEADFSVTDGNGDELPVDVNLFYRHASHVVHLKPREDLSPDTAYTVETSPDIETIHGHTLPGWAFRFATGDATVEPLNLPWHEARPAASPPAEDPPDEDPPANADAEDASSCSTARGMLQSAFSRRR